jgi:hypothetical protein
MRTCYKLCKNTAQVNSYLKKIIGDNSFEFNPGYFEFNQKDFDWDGWIDNEEKKGISLWVLVQPWGLDVYLVKYNRRQIELREIEWELEPERLKAEEAKRLSEQYEKEKAKLQEAAK